MSKFFLKCSNCSYITSGFNEWFKSGQKCSQCGDIYSEVIYNNKINYKDILTKNAISSMWHYFDLLPLNNVSNITTTGEGVTPIDQWEYLELIAKKYFNISCDVRVLRNDNNPGTGTFKDLAGTVVSSVLKENEIKNYVVASTGNIGASFSKYLALNNITLFAFIPEYSPKLQEAEIISNGGIVYRVKGDYHAAKVMAEKFALKNKFLLAATGVDPTRIEAKKTIAYEFFRQLKKIPSVYIQALSGGTGPLGIHKGVKELIMNQLATRQPRFLLVQSNKCSPMADAYQQARKDNFLSSWNLNYPVYANPKTKITTLATGNPTLYPYVSTIVKESFGDIFCVNEAYTKTTSKLISLLQGVKIGPAAAIAVEGFFKALSNGQIKNNDLVVINIGEGAKRTPEYLEQFYKGKIIKDLAECQVDNIANIREEIIQYYIEKVIKNL